MGNTVTMTREKSQISNKMSDNMNIIGSLKKMHKKRSHGNQPITIVLSVRLYYIQYNHQKKHT